MRKGFRGKNEQGLVSIMVATILMIILSLITVGFARLMQREQRLSLDRTLSTGAFYAAESAVDEAVNKIQNKNYTSNKSTCATDVDFSGQVDSALGASYTCLLIDQSPDTLEYTQGAIKIDQSKVIPFSSETGVKIGQISIGWEASSAPSGTTFEDCSIAPTKLPAFSSWTNPTGMLRIDVIPADLASMTRQSLIDNTVSLYLYPCNSGGVSVSQIDFASNLPDGTKGQIIPVSCATSNTPRDCLLILDKPVGNAKYYIRARSVYKPSDMTIRIYDTTTPTANQLAIKDAQVLIDATGKVNDVLRRIQVRVPVHKTYQVPEYVIETTDSICKQIQIAPPDSVFGVGPDAGQTCPY